MISRSALSVLFRSQQCMKLLLTYQGKLNVHSAALLQYQDVQNSSIVSSGPSVFTLDSPSSKSPPKSTDILETKLLQAKSSNEVLKLVATHCSIMNNRHISTTFSLFHDYMKEKSREELSAVVCNQDFLKLCKRTVQAAHHFTPDEAITIFKTLGFLNVPSTTNIMQVMCQVIRQNINSLPLNQIVFLIFLLRKQQPTPLVEALLIALPLVLQSQLDLQMDPENLSEMVYCLEVAITRKLSDKVIQKLSDAVLLKADQLTVRHASVIIASFVPECQLPSTFEQLVFKSFDILAQNINNITDKEAMMLLSKVRKMPFFSKSFVSALIDKAIERKWNLNKLSQLLTICEKHEFISEELLNFTMQEMQQNETELTNNSKISLTNIVGPFALVGYESVASKDVWTTMANCEKKLGALQKKSPLLFFKLISELSLLGCHPHPSVFDDDVLSSVSENIKKGRLRLAQELCIIEWTTKIMNSTFVGPHFPENIFQDAINRIWEEQQKRNFFLEPFLRIGLGGTQFFETNLMTRHGHTIDHVVILRKGDFPIAIEKHEDSVSNKNPEAIKFIEDLIAPPESKILVIIAADKSCFCRNSSHLKGRMKFHLHTLSKLGYLPLLIKSESWQGLLSHEKIPFLMREIKDVLKQSEQEDAVNAYPIM